MAATKFVIDAHALLWYVSGDPRLGAAAKAVLDDPASDLVLPTIALAEACWALERGRYPGLSPANLLRAVGRDKRIRVRPLTRAIVRRTLTMTAIGEMHDRQIAAAALRVTDRGGRAILLTKDADITRSGLVPVLW